MELLKGSMNTFLNAFTYPDRTCYPVASQNLKDFYNLINVYLDSVLHPALTPWSGVESPPPSALRGFILHPTISTSRTRSICR